MQLVTWRVMVFSRSLMNSRSSTSSRVALPMRWFMSWMKPEMTVSGPLMSWMMLA